MAHKGKGNIKQQRKRRKARAKNNLLVEYREEFYKMIDGNFTNYPYGYCKYYDGWLTINMANTHNCLHKSCANFIYYDDMDFSVEASLDDRDN